MSPRPLVYALCLLVALLSLALALQPAPPAHGGAAAVSSHDAAGLRESRVVLGLLAFAGAVLAAVAVFALPAGLVQERPWIPWAIVLAGVAVPFMVAGARAAWRG